MTERHTNINEFDETTISAALGTESRTTRDIAHGEGHALHISDGQTVLEVYPQSGVARVTTENARVELYRIPGVTVDTEQGRVVFEDGQDGKHSRLVIRGTGDVHLYPQGEAVTPLDTTESDSTSQEPVQGATDTSERSDQDGSKENEPVTLRGRLGRDPWFSNGDTPKAGFPLAINNDQGQATWHKVVAFGDLAQQIKDRSADVRKGRLVDVTGQTVVREEEDKKVTEFHATEVSRVRATKRPRQQD